MLPAYVFMCVSVALLGQFAAHTVFYDNDFMCQRKKLAVMHLASKENNGTRMYLALVFSKATPLSFEAKQDA